MELIKFKIAQKAKKIGWKKIVLYPLLIIPFCFVLNIAIAPIYKMLELEAAITANPMAINKYDSIYNHSEFTGLVKQRAYKEALLKASSNDSIQLAINLLDSTVCLYIKGVRIHTAQVKSFNIDHLFHSMTNLQLANVFSGPLNVTSEYATIVKEPIVVREAPKDTLEAASNTWKPDTLIQSPAFLILTSEYDLAIIFEQEANPSFYDNWAQIKFYNKLWFNDISSSLLRFASFKRQNYRPTIKIKVPVDDLRTIYRALPQHANVILCI